MQAQIDGILDVIAREVTGASEHATNAATSEDNAAEYARQARESADDALVSENAAAGHAEAARVAANTAMSQDHKWGRIFPSSIELTPIAGSTIGGYIDFHYGGTETDYTSRIVETTHGVIDVFGTLRENGHRVYSPGNKPSAWEIGAVRLGGGVGQLSNALSLGWSNDRGLRVVVDSTDVGSIPLTGSSDNVVLPVAKGGTGVRTLEELRDALKAIW